MGSGHSGLVAGGEGWSSYAYTGSRHLLYLITRSCYNWEAPFGFALSPSLPVFHPHPAKQNRPRMHHRLCAWLPGSTLSFSENE